MKNTTTLIEFFPANKKDNCQAIFMEGMDDILTIEVQKDGVVRIEDSVGDTYWHGVPFKVREAPSDITHEVMASLNGQ